jgi:hydroxymethylpyrimidine kinase/phosphomethylpyrimidine kinase/thiamine-phosphate diphosphorylase
MKAEDRPRVALTIAGSDPSGGAGVQADLRAFAALGVAGLSAITAITAQSSRGVRGVFPVPPEQLTAQLDALVDDSPPHALKIGMLGGRAQVEAVAALLSRWQPPNVVLDPVLASTGGVPLLDAEGRAAVLNRLLLFCDLVTPNREEAAALAGLPPEADPSALAAPFLARGVRAVLVKGGHLPGDPVDVLVSAAGALIAFPGARIETPHSHGTGCLLSAAICARLALGDPLIDAVARAKAFLTAALRRPVVVGQGRGFPGASAHAERLSRLRGLYAIADAGVRPDRPPEAVAAAALAGGARVIQLRDKRSATPTLVAAAKRLATLARSAGALFIVNDRVDVALAADADGVHLGPQDMAPEDARRLLGPERLIGVSVSSVAEAASLAAHASYFGVGAIFATATKSDAGAPIGLTPLEEIRRAFPAHPIVAVGGIGPETIGDVLAAGADAAAVVSAIAGAADMEGAARELLQRTQRAVQ